VINHQLASNFEAWNDRSEAGKTSLNDMATAAR
jgi:hypothetical protein